MNLKNKKYENLKVFTHRTSLSLQLYLGIFEYFIYKYFFHVVMSMTKAIIKYCFRNKLNGEIHRCEIRFSSVIFIKNLKNYWANLRYWENEYIFQNDGFFSYL